MNHAIPYNPKCEMMAREELQQLQIERLQATLNRVYRSVAFYRTAFDAHKVNLEKLKNVVTTWAGTAKPKKEEDEVI